MPRISLPELTWASHVEEWKECARCDLHERRQHVVLGKGVLPCDVFFLGEAPGESEDVKGLPFVGPAGHLLDEVIAAALPGASLRLAWGNVVACIPRDEDGAKAGQPHAEALLECRPRVNELLRLARPRLIVCVGALAAKWLDEVWEMRASVCKIVHPAAILRERNPVDKRIMFQRATVALRAAIAGIFPEAFPADPEIS